MWDLFMATDGKEVGEGVQGRMLYRNRMIWAECFIINIYDI